MLRILIIRANIPLVYKMVTQNMLRTYKLKKEISRKIWSCTSYLAVQILSLWSCISNIAHLLSSLWSCSLKLQVDSDCWRQLNWIHVRTNEPQSCIKWLQITLFFRKMVSHYALRACEVNQKILSPQGICLYMN